MLTLQDIGPLYAKKGRLAFRLTIQIQAKKKYHLCYARLFLELRTEMFIAGLTEGQETTNRSRNSVDNVRELCEERGVHLHTCDAFSSNLRTTFTAMS